MDDMMFQRDTVLSDVHLHTPSKRQFMVRLNAVGQPVFLSQFKLLLDKSNWHSEKGEKDVRKENLKHPEKCGEELSVKDISECEDSSNSTGKEVCSLKGIEALLDEDGDLEVVRKPQLPYTEEKDFLRVKVCPIILTKGGGILEEQEEDDSCSDVIKIEHTMATPLEDVGKQIWRGAFLLADFILCNQALFKNCTVLELGGGTGIVSIIAAKAARTIYCTDIGKDLLDMCERNIALNKHLTKPAGSKVKVRVLDWMKADFCTDPENPYSWSEKEIVELHDLSTVILAADVFYDDDLTDAFFRTLYRITSNLTNPSTIYLSVEKRLNFTRRHMDVVCEAYNHFQSGLKDLLNIRDDKMRYTTQPVQLSFPQHIVYERVEQLELWKITAERRCSPNPKRIEVEHEDIQSNFPVGFCSKLPSEWNEEPN
ncbi:methyltransferase-like protein 22 [Varanus komodoensis]|uniref:Methyltransferase like 22 n=1 Tax=Varanus komodoensis TaxID=61221 RepID=A0A8D2LMQ1_VARKO|nr:methyltransferase-like protein 22 [Varanus komodoensis]XP_044308489.1 methyltransferase-like protein 22 [Varanus komodoensis]XP_044308490.1 methyltransferase-like protein 22 [Varanus komodoensis]XP_044308491.1 methyltransferase-like protein 22 [Varanus komodoensis]XP_044308492.1 methyltransferase-like protein 22 [Varanus komodoensis]XP_044308494.1 methyltransferase-like protein 22 [Varanus komodoensis]XP_044308495.1 methyltransferase-like protein 22 [Varanus komodoensis]XP_044308496.1 met